MQYNKSLLKLKEVLYLNHAVCACVCVICVSEVVKTFDCGDFNTGFVQKHLMALRYCLQRHTQTYFQAIISYQNSQNYI